MFSCQNKAEPIQNVKKKAKICAVAWTITYVLFFPTAILFCITFCYDI